VVTVVQISRLGYRLRKEGFFKRSTNARRVSKTLSKTRRVSNPEEMIFFSDAEEGKCEIEAPTYENKEQMGQNIITNNRDELIRTTASLCDNSNTFDEDKNHTAKDSREVEEDVEELAELALMFIQDITTNSDNQMLKKEDMK